MELRYEYLGRFLQTSSYNAMDDITRYVSELNPRLLVLCPWNWEADVAKNEVSSQNRIHFSI
jgi:hypothetical protein